MGRPVTPNKSYQSPLGGWYVLEIESKKYGLIRTIVDTEDYEFVKDFRWSVNGEAPHLYVCGWVNGKFQRLTRYLFESLSLEEKVDHINGDTLDNRRINLRVCSHSENMRNQKRKSKGVSYSKKLNIYRARITVDNSTIALGTYKTEEEAVKVYDLACKFFHGEFARTNNA
jgi:hypothetical protein